MKNFGVVGWKLLLRKKGRGCVGEEERRERRKERDWRVRVTLGICVCIG